MIENKISVIIPIYGVELYLEKCIESVVNQSYKNIEIILVDDGSKDRCPQICDKWMEQDKRIITIHKSNGGLSDARNAGLSIASGDFIAFVDSDDWIDENYLKTMYEVARSKDSEIVACGYIKWYSNNSYDIEKISTVDLYLEDNEFILRDYFSRCRCKTVVWNKLYSRKVLKGILFEVGKCSEDEFFTYMVLNQCKKMVIISECLYYYRQRENSIMGYFAIRRLDALDGLYRQLVFVENKFPDLLLEKKVSYIYMLLYFYSQLDNCVLKKDKINGKQILKEYRKKIKFTKCEMCQLNHKDKLMIIVSKHSLSIIPFVRQYFRFRKVRRLFEK